MPLLEIPRADISLAASPLSLFRPVLSCFLFSPLPSADEEKRLQRGAASLIGEKMTPRREPLSLSSLTSTSTSSFHAAAPLCLHTAPLDSTSTQKPFEMMFSRAAFLFLALACALALYVNAQPAAVPAGGFTPLAGTANITAAFLAKVASANPIRLPMARFADFLDANAKNQSVVQALWSTSNLARKLNATTAPVPVLG